MRKVLADPLRLHDLRHTPASPGSCRPASRRTSSKRSPAIQLDVTMTIYAHASLDEKRAALRLLSDRLA